MWRKQNDYQLQSPRPYKASFRRNILEKLLQKARSGLKEEKKNIWVVLILQEWVFRVGVGEEGAILEWLEIKGDEDDGDDDVIFKLNHRKAESYYWSTMIF